MNGPFDIVKKYGGAIEFIHRDLEVKHEGSLRAYEMSDIRDKISFGEPDWDLLMDQFAARDSNM